MKTFNQYIKEYATPKVVDGTVDGDEMLGNISNDSVVEKLNAYIGAIADREYLNPEKQSVR